MDFAMTDFNYFDVTIAAVVLLLGIKGFMQGFIKEAFGLAGLIGGVYFGSRLSEKAATFIDTNFFHLENTSLLKLLGFMAILIIVWVGATLLGSIFSKLTSASGLGFLNRLFGFIVGGGKYFVIFALIVTALSNIKLVQEKLTNYTKDSIVYPYLHETGTYLINLDPSTLGLPLETNQETPAETNTTTDVNSSTVEHNITAP